MAQGDQERFSAQELEDIKEQDKHAQENEATAAEEVLRLRWFWTQAPDDVNPRKLSPLTYAALTEVAAPYIQRDAKAYQILQESIDSGVTITPDQARERARLGTETEAATDAVAQSHGIGIKSARLEHSEEIKRVRDTARQEVENNPQTSFAEAARRAAEEQKEKTEFRELAKAADHRREEERRQRLGIRFREVEELLSQAERALSKAVRVSADLDFTPEQRALLAYRLGKVHQLVALLDGAAVGHFESDWGEKLRVLEGGATR